MIVTTIPVAIMIILCVCVSYTLSNYFTHLHSLPRIFLGILGFGLSILFCTTFCRACSPFREEQIEREVWRRNEQEARRNPIFFIPFPRNGSESENQFRVPRYSEEVQAPPRYSTAAYCGPPPSYNEVIKEQKTL